MGFEQHIELNNLKKDENGQLDLSFDDSTKDKNAEEELKKEKNEIALKYKIINLDGLIKKDGDWYFDGMKVEEYDDLMSGKDADELYGRNNT